jgi:hypothetical protein
MIISKQELEDDPRGALILYENLLTTNGGSEVAPEALIPNTWERWRPSAGAVSAEWELSSATEINCVALAAHNLSGQTFTIEYAATDGGAKTVLASLSPTDNKPILITFDPVTALEIHLIGTFTAGAELGVIYAGNYLRMKRNIYGGHSPITLSNRTRYRSNISDTGQFLGRDITTQGAETAFEWSNLNPDWYREYFQPFVISAKTKPFFISWRPDLYADEVAFGYTERDITPSNQGGGTNLMSVSMKVKSHEDI